MNKNTEDNFEEHIELIATFDEFTSIAEASGDYDVAQYWRSVKTNLQFARGDKSVPRHLYLRHNGPALRAHLDKVMRSISAEYRLEFLEMLRGATRVGHERGALTLPQLYAIRRITDAVEKEFGHTKPPFRKETPTSKDGGTSDSLSALARRLKLQK